VDSALTRGGRLTGSWSSGARTSRLIDRGLQAQWATVTSRQRMILWTLCGKCAGVGGGRQARRCSSAGPESRLYGQTACPERDAPHCSRPDPLSPSWHWCRPPEKVPFLAAAAPLQGALVRGAAVSFPWSAPRRASPSPRLPAAALRPCRRPSSALHRPAPRRPASAPRRPAKPLPPMPLPSRGGAFCPARQNRRRRGKVRRVYAKFNNNNWDYPVRNALAFRRLLGQDTPDLETVRAAYTPPARRPRRRPSLPLFPGAGQPQPGSHPNLG